MFQQDMQNIIGVIEDYFRGIFYGDVSLLQNVFHPQALLFGDVNNQAYFKTVDDYIETVKNRQSPSSLNEDFKMMIISIEKENNIVMARLRTPMFQYLYSDYLTLNKIDGRWLIVGKLFTNVN